MYACGHKRNIGDSSAWDTGGQKEGGHHRRKKLREILADDILAVTVILSRYIRDRGVKMDKDNRISQMSMIWTNPIAYELSKKLVEERQLDCNVILAELQKVEEVVEAEEKRGIKVIIARGGVWNRIQKMVSIPLVAVRFAFSDFASAIDEASKYGKQIAMIVFSDEMLESAKREYYYWKVKTVVIKVADINEARKEISNLKEKGISAIVGGVTIQKLAAEREIPSALFGCNEDVILEAIYEAQRLLKLLLAQEVRYRTISLLIDNSSEGMMTLDNNGVITNINQVALKILGGEFCGEDVLGRKCLDIFPFPAILSGTLQGKRYYNYLVEYRNHYLAVSSLPIVTDNAINGIIINIQDSDDIQAVENKIRRHSVTKGYSAKYTFQHIIGKSEKIIGAKHQAMMYAGVDSTVMICGDSGTGKELFAQSIHNASSRRNQPFVAVNCAAFPESLLESELFGYEKGAFTGANPNGKAGIFEMAHKGTIFLDEIGEMAVSLQSRLLRVIQEREVIRLGGSFVIPIDVRIITATNKNLFEEMQKGNFRKDLYYRLSVLTLQLPLLEERVEDIVPLAVQFAMAFGKKHGREITGIAPGAQELLKAHRYFGNIRELSNIIERAAIFAVDTEISKDDVSMALSGNAFSGATYQAERAAVIGRELAAERDVKKDSEMATSKTLEPKEQKEMGRIIAALRSAEGNHEKAAALLRISRTTLWRKMKKYEIELADVEMNVRGDN